MKYKKVNTTAVEEALYSMANVPAKIHKLGVDVKLHLYQPGNKKIPHAPRVKVFRKSLEDGFSVILDKDLTKMKVKRKPFLKEKEFKKVVDGIKKYRIPFLMMWHDETMDVFELRSLMDKVDKDVKLELKES